MKAVPIIISVVSLIVSLYTLYATRLAGFNLRVVTTSRVALTSNPQSPGAKKPAFVMRFLLSNTGAKFGYIHDIAVSVSRLDSKGKEFFFRSLFEQTKDELNLTSGLPPPSLAAFTSFPVPPGQTVAKEVVFVPIDSDSDMNFEQGSYLFTPYTRELGQETTWKNWPVSQIDIKEEDLQALQRTTAIPTKDGGQFVKWSIHSKPTNFAETALRELREIVNGKGDKGSRK